MRRPQHCLLDLSHRVSRQVIHDEDDPRLLEACEPTIECSADRGGVHVRARSDDHEGRDPFAHVRVRQTHHG